MDVIPVGSERLPRLPATAFQTAAHTPIATVSAAQMRALDGAAEGAGYGLPHMVEHAGRHLADLSGRLGMWPRRAPRVVILAGPGGNGAGVLAAARHLANGGAAVKVLLATSEADAGPEATRQLRLASTAGAALLGPGAMIPGGADLLLDGLVGYGLRGALRGRMHDLTLEANAVATRRGALLISLDVPSGLLPDTGEAEGAVMRPAATLTVALPKHGLLHPGTGDVWLADIGIPRRLFAAAGVTAPPAEIAANGLSALTRHLDPVPASR